MRLKNSLIEQVAPRRMPYVDKQMSLGGDGSIAYGMAFQDGVPEDLSDNELRTWRENNVWIFSAVSQRRTGANSDWLIAPEDPTQPYDDSVIDRITNFLLNPQTEYGLSTSYGGLVEPWVDDGLVLDKGVLQPRFRGNGEPSALKHLDAARFVPNVKWKVGSPKSVARYYYDAEGTGYGTPFYNDELIVLQSNPLTYRPTGLAPLRILRKILLAEYDTFKSIHILQKNRTPAGLLKMPGASKQAVDTVRDMFLAELAGKSGIGFMNIPADSDFIELGSVNLAEQGAFAFYDMLIRAIATAFRTTTLNLNWLQDVNRATAQEQSALTDDGMVALLKLIQTTFTQGIVKKFKNSDNLAFYYTQLMVRDEALAVTTIREMGGHGVNWSSINQMLVAQGYPPIKGRPAAEQVFYDYPTIQVANGQFAPVPLAAKLPQYQSAQAQQEAKLAEVNANRPPQLPPPTPSEPEPQPARAMLHATNREKAIRRLEWAGQRGHAVPNLVDYREKSTPQEDIQAAQDDLYAEIDSLYTSALERARR